MYDYLKEREKIFTEDGQEMFLKIRDNTKKLLDTAGAASLGKMINCCTGDVWVMIACVDRMIELGEIKEITNAHAVWAQNRVFVKS